MLKSTLLATVFGLALIVPASAENNMKCDEETMTSMMTEIEALTDAGKKDAAMKEMQMAKDMMASKDDVNCVTHLDNAGKIYR